MALPTTPANPRSGVSAIWRDVPRLHDASVAPREIDSTVDNKMFRDFTYLTDHPAKQVSDFMAPSEDIEDCSSVDALFGQYLRSPSPSPSPSPSLLPSLSTAYSSSPSDTASEMSGAILIDGALDPTRSSEKSNTGPLRVSGTEDTPEKEVVQDQGATSCTGNGTRLRLRVSRRPFQLQKFTRKYRGQLSGAGLTLG